MLQGLGVAWALTLLLGALGEQEQGPRGPGAGEGTGGKQEEEEEGPPLTALKYLGQYGHLTQPHGNFSLFDSFEDGLRSFQKWVGLNQSGTLDRATTAAMARPRCGVADWGLGHTVTQVEIGHKERADRQRRFSFYEGGFFGDILDMIAPRLRPHNSPSSRWRSLSLTYRVSKYPVRSGLSRALVDSQIASAFALWASVTDLTFTERSYGAVHMDISFHSRQHGDGDSFDGRGGVLAHSYFPIYGGDVHFDDDERWVTKSLEPGTHLLHVAAHEFGHALGLPHIPGDASALMGPTIDDGQVYEVKLGQADIQAIQKLYGPKTNGRIPNLHQPPTTEASFWLGLPWSKQEEESESLCSGPAPDCLIGGVNGGWAVRGDKVWELDEKGDPLGRAKDLRDVWPGLPKDPDAGFTWHNGLTFIFKGSRYYRYRNSSLDPGFPRRISQGFTGLPSFLTLALLRGKHIYFVKKSKYWVFSPASKPPISKPMNLPQGVSSAKLLLGLSLPGNRSFLFTGQNYWRLKKGSFTIDRSASPSYPRRTRDWWWGCRDTRMGELRTSSGNSISSFLFPLPLLLLLLSSIISSSFSLFPFPFSYFFFYSPSSFLSLQ